MAAGDEGIVLSKRNVFILIFVSLFINVFFLLMGILIGKDDVKWTEGASQPAIAKVETVTEDPEPAVDSIESELSLFEDEQRADPVNPQYLDQGDVASNTAPANTAPPRTVTPQPEPQRTQPRQTPPRQTSTPPAAKPNTSPDPIHAVATVYWIQIAAVGNQAKAEEQLKKARAKQFSGMLVREGGLYKVRLGPYAARASADSAKARIKRVLGIDGYMVTKP